MIDMVEKIIVKLPFRLVERLELSLFVAHIAASLKMDVNAFLVHLNNVGEVKTIRVIKSEAASPRPTCISSIFLTPLVSI